MKKDTKAKYCENYFDKKRELQNQIQKLKEKIKVLDAEFIDFMNSQKK